MAPVLKYSAQECSDLCTVRTAALHTVTCHTVVINPLVEIENRSMGKQCSDFVHPATHLFLGLPQSCLTNRFIIWVPLAARKRNFPGMFR